MKLKKSLDRVHDLTDTEGVPNAGGVKGESMMKSSKQQEIRAFIWEKHFGWCQRTKFIGDLNNRVAVIIPEIHQAFPDTANPSHEDYCPKSLDWMIRNVLKG